MREQQDPSFRMDMSQALDGLLHPQAQTHVNRFRDPQTDQRTSETKGRSRRFAVALPGSEALGQRGPFALCHPHLEGRRLGLID